MHDPIGAFQRIRELYLSYLDTAFRIEDPTLAEERQSLLRRPGQLCTSPLLEAQPRWASYEFAFDQIRNAADEGFGEPAEPVLGHMTQTAREAFVDLIGCGLMPSSGVGMDRKLFPPYRHQAQMLARGCRDGQAGVVTSGTGSGKTEAFLLPILATIVEEATREGKEWAGPEPGYLQQFWWRMHDGLPMAERSQHGKYEIRSDMRFTDGQALRWDGYTANRKRIGERRKPAIRALILYPMNALVEDQMCRLRLALDSREARECQDRHLNGNRIFFGRYTGKTKGGPAFRMPHEEILGNLDAQELRQTVAQAIQGLPQDGTVLRDWKNRVAGTRKRRIEEVIVELSQADDLQREIRRAAGLAEDQQMGLDADQDQLDRAFAFPSVDGGELLTRWDMQDTPPDILVTNISMLNAMLSRRTEAGMLEATREWLESDPANRFTLVIDELHLQRGSEGTEFIYLLRLLIARLGLDDPQRHDQLRILASSASLPVEGEQAESSLDYLYDAFADFGMPYGSSRNDWKQAIVPGFPISIPEEQPLPPGLTEASLLDEAIDELLESEWGRKGMQPDELFTQADLEGDGEAFKTFFDAMGVEEGELLERWVRFAYGVGVLLEKNSKHVGAAPLATTLTHLADQIWGVTAWADDRDPEIRNRRIERNLRVLTVFVGAIDGDGQFADQLKRTGARLELEAPRFRVHTFFKSPEGLFVDVVPSAWRSGDAPERWQGNLSLDRQGTTSTSSAMQPDHEVRQFELLYCEACGETFLGGMRSGTDQDDPDVLVEILPDEGRIERLPDLPVADRFEELTHDQYVVIWPKDDAGEHLQAPEHPEESWVRGFLDVGTGIVKRNSAHSEGMLQPVYVFRRLLTRGMNVFANDQSGSHTPCSCPRCDTDYGARRRLARSGQQVSPLRNFRAGFAKSTQLLATEAYDVMARGGDRSKAKLVSFSDSRQDAARSALDVERFRHQDVVREVLFSELRSAAREIQNRLPDEERRLERQKKMLEGLLEEKAADNGTPPQDLLEDIENQEAEIQKLEKKITQAKAGIVPLSEIVEVTAPRSNAKVLPFLTRLLELRIHPYDERGIKKVEIRGARSSWVEWWRLFQKAPDGEGYCWRIPEGYNLDESDFRRLANAFLAEKVLSAIGDVIFKKNYFALESAGFAYPVPLELSLLREDGTFDLRRMEQVAAWMRIYADQYRFAPSDYQKCDGLDPSSMTRTSGLAKTVRRIAEAMGGVDPVDFFRRGQDLMAEAGYSDSGGDYVRLARMGFRIAADSDPVLRCSNCRRVHLHQGIGVCTRCGGNFSPPESCETVGLLIHGNFLGRRLARALDDNGDRGDVFRLRCEELTAQTLDPAQRQREFKGIRLQSERGDQLAPHGIEMLMVTTTMEVGIDIGPLQTVLQANMPPQRFNYQQRVGRAGRRGQAFSFVVTLCRSKSHDLHYFKRPESITGDAPPPPFLVKRLARIAERLIRKDRLVRAFDLIRTEDRGTGLCLWAGDVVRPVDVHGDFIPTTILEAPEDVRQFWLNRLLQALERGQDRTEAIVKLFERGRREGSGDYEDLQLESARQLIDEVFATTSTAASNTPGLAAHLADRGLLPMYGLPTRVRQLVIGRSRNDVSGDQVESIDRDLEIAIYEFAPGNVLVHDKKEHLCIGLTPRINRAGSEFVTSGPVADRFFHLANCSVCGSHHRMNDDDLVESICPSCGALIGADATVNLCLEPASFRTDFIPRSEETSRLPGGRGRSLCADSKPPDGPWLESKPQAHDTLAVELKWNVSPESTVYRINRGLEQANGGRGFMFRGKVGLLASGFTQGTPGPLASQAIDERCLQGNLSRAILGDATAPLDFENQPVYLAAQRVTDGLYLQPTGLNPLLALDRLGRNLQLPFDTQAGIGLNQATGESYWQGVRAAAVSALEVLAGRASLKLDIDRAALEVLEPRLFGPPERLLPLFQIVDAHVNGAGFSAWLGKTDTVVPPIVAIVHELLESQNEENGWFRDEHADDCGEACYRCLKSYDNQSLHGLLDWRLGLCYLRAFADPGWNCGLDGDLSWKPLAQWPQKARALAEATVMLWGGTLGADTIRSFVPTGWTHELTAFRIPLGTGSPLWLSPWIILRHPLWNCGASVDGPLGEFRDHLIGEGHYTLCWDDFNLRRRRGMTKQWIVSMSPPRPRPTRRRRSP